jgi:23S rRNA pseudouridine955/2504/2580 synthase
MFLHARRLGFTHPASADTITLDAALPPDCQALLDRLTQLDDPRVSPGRAITVA